ncbi:MAG: sigma-70 family RNA polymerase sigma factor [Odoribacteraceae bacterium]|jgi:RNA polymerase sigma factor (sigma-70 family)|nr:sigma-70 family RNA polymerase sigma factor [Odoribacteraceae bacterium]
MIPPVNHTGDDEAERVLLESFARGEREAFASIYTRHADALLSYGAGLGFDRETLKDALHDIFYKLYATPRLATGVRDVKSYLFRALRNRLINGRRGGQRETSLDPTGREFSIEVSIVDAQIEEEERSRVATEIERYLNELTPRQREAIYLRFIQEFDYDEVARLLDMTPHAARKLVSRAIATIRDHYPLLVIFFRL